MALGAPQTAAFQIGTSEVRVGPLSSAGKLAASASIGVLDNVTLEVSQDSVDLMAGFPQVIVDTAITKQAATLTATLREFSSRNLSILLGNGVPSGSAPADVKTTVNRTAAHTAGAVTLKVTTATGLSVGDFITVYHDGAPEETTVTQITAISTNDLTISPGLVDAIPDSGTVATGTWTVYKSVLQPIGAVYAANYFSVQVISMERKNPRPSSWIFWKAAIGSGMNLAMSPTEFASTQLQLKLLRPSAAEYATGGNLFHMKDVIPSNPVGYRAGSSDAA